MASHAVLPPRVLYSSCLVRPSHGLRRVGMLDTLFIQSRRYCLFGGTILASMASAVTSLPVAGPNTEYMRLQDRRQ